MIGMEGGHSIDNSLAALRMFYKLGARYMTLSHSQSTPWAESSSDEARGEGLSAFGKDVVREMNWLGMLVDLSHVSPATMHDALDVSEVPIIYSHSSARAITDHSRNVPDDVLRRLPDNGGVVMVTFVSSFVSTDALEHRRAGDAERERLRELPGSTEDSVREAMEQWAEANPAPRGTVSLVADHIDHVREVAGIDHIGLGSDYDGTTNVPRGLDDVSTFPALTAELLERGYTDQDVMKLLGLNLLRVMRDAEAVAERLQRDRGPSEALIEEVDGASLLAQADDDEEEARDRVDVFRVIPVLVLARSWRSSGVSGHQEAACTREPARDRFLPRWRRGLSGIDAGANAYRFGLLHRFRPKELRAQRPADWHCSDSDGRHGVVSHFGADRLFLDQSSHR